MGVKIARIVVQFDASPVGHTRSVWALLSDLSAVKLQGVQLPPLLDFMTVME
jgi:hypothetical protein